MRVKVIKQFRDKYTKTVHKLGETLTVTKERFEEISSAAPGPFVEEIKELKKQPKTKKTKKK